jgi:hypothetical protein
MGGNTMDRKFFVTVIAPDRPALVRLRRYDLDLFHQTAQATSTRAVALRATRDRSGARTYEETAKVNETREFVIDGLLSLTEVGRLVDDGYQVLLKENDARKARARREVIEFEEWLKGMEE